MNLNKLVRDNIKSLTGYSSARSEFNQQGKIYLDANESPFQNGVNRYPDPFQNELKQLLAKRKNSTNENILLGNGSDEVLDLIFRCFCEPKKDNILLFTPTYGMYEVLAAINEIDIRSYALDEKFDFDPSGVLKKTDENTKLIFVCSPNNPSGNRIDSDKIIALANSFNGLIILDEAYIEFTKEGSLMKELNNLPNLIICQTMSKAYGMAGIRLGMAFASKQIVAILNKVKPPYNINQLTINKAINVLNDPNKLEREISTIIKEREKLASALNKLAIVITVFPSDANFLLVRFTDAYFVYQNLIAQGIVVRNRAKEFNCDNCLRISIGTKNENEQLLKALKTII